ncbi:MAG: response regulator transcription factor [Anaerolineae bacterium]|nr:response regulator transcription factor [Anaerolineae bacterium]
MATELRALVIADNPLARTGLAALLAEQAGVVVAGQAAADDDLLAAVDLFRPDVLVWDLGWDPAPALERLADVREAGGLPVVALVADEASAVDALATMAGGAYAVLLRAAGGARVAAALRAAAEGLVALDPALSEAARRAREPAAPPLEEALTPRELEVLQLLAEGLPNKAIATRLDISEHTVKFHVNAIFAKLGAQSRTEAVVRATRLGLVIL